MKKYFKKKPLHDYKIIKPYGILLNCDILKGFKNIKDDSVDLIITSPPYNVGIKYDNWNDKLSVKKYYKFVALWLKECYRVLRDDDRIAINIPLEVNMKEGEDSNRLFIVSDYWNIMDKIGFKWFGLARLQENAPHRVKYTAWGSYKSPSSPYIYNAEECVLLAYKNVKKKIKKGRTKITKEDFVKGVTGMWSYTAETHGLTMANFSLDIPFTAINMLSWEKDVVMDPFMGSGTTAVACIKTKRKFIGIEISNNYFNVSIKRIDKFLYKKKIHSWWDEK